MVKPPVAVPAPGLKRTSSMSLKPGTLWVRVKNDSWVAPPNVSSGVISQLSMVPVPCAAHRKLAAMYESAGPACAPKTPELPWNQGLPGGTLLLTSSQLPSVPTSLKSSVRITVPAAWAVGDGKAASPHAAAASMVLNVFMVGLSCGGQVNRRVLALAVVEAVT